MKLRKGKNASRRDRDRHQRIFRRRTNDSVGYTHYKGVVVWDRYLMGVARTPFGVDAVAVFKLYYKPRKTERLAFELALSSNYRNFE